MQSPGRNMRALRYTYPDRAMKNYKRVLLTSEKKHVEKCMKHYYYLALRHSFAYLINVNYDRQYVLHRRMIKQIIFLS